MNERAIAAAALDALHTVIRGPATPVLLAGIGLWLSFRSGWVQLRLFPRAMRMALEPLFSRKRRETYTVAGKKEGSLSSFEAFSTALAGTVGTGNIAGVAGAVLTGGMGAVFWMWFSAFLGMCTKYMELFLAVRFRCYRRGEALGGPMYYIELGLGSGWRWMALAFSFCGAMAGFGIGNLAQSREIAGALEGLLGIPPALGTALLTVCCGMVLLGGAQRIARAAAAVAPAMAGIYLLCGLGAAALHPGEVPRFFATVCAEAFHPQSAGGGLVGILLSKQLREGFARGVFSNEAGLGSAPIAHGATAAVDPREEALWGIFEVFVDTFVVCTVTAFLLFTSGVAGEGQGNGASFPTGGAAAAAAFARLFPGMAGSTAVRVFLVLFAFSTILSWCYYGQRCFGYLFRESRRAETVYRFLFLLVLPLGGMGSADWILELSDTLNALMAFPNLIALALLSGAAMPSEKKPGQQSAPRKTSV